MAAYHAVNGDLRGRTESSAADSAAAPPSDSAPASPSNSAAASPSDSALASPSLPSASSAPTATAAATLASLDGTDSDRCALLVIGSLVSECSRPSGTGSMSPAIYDTAWLAMLSRVAPDGSGPFWLFPECFQYILDTQRLGPERGFYAGGWPSYTCPVDGILNTMAALLALLKHYRAEHTLRDATLPANIWTRIENARDSLQAQLQDWDVQSSDQVGFEILIPALLAMLETSQARPQQGESSGQTTPPAPFDYSFTFSFQGRAALMALHDAKMEHFQPEMLYGKQQTTALHSLEAFIGKIDFDKVRHHLTGEGSMMASPSSTSAYLMNCSAWDDAAERYLRMVVTEGAGRGSGSVPCAFPTTNFELAWVLSTLLKAGFSTAVLGPYNLSVLAAFLEREFQARDGTIGFAPSVLADADDTAMAILTLRLLGRHVSPDRMIAEFEAETHFQTYKLERNVSFSANCNVLNALLHVEDPSEYTPKIIKAAAFLCKIWIAGDVKDKWNLCPQYLMMLLAQTLRRLMVLWDLGDLPGLPQDLIRDQIPLVLLQILHRTLHSQNPDGSWGKDASLEGSAYAVLTLVDASLFPWTKPLDAQAAMAIGKGREFLSQSRDRWSEANYIWIEKVSYSSSVLSKTYCIAAIKAASLYPTPYQWTTSAHDLVDISDEKVLKFSQFFSRIPLFADEPEWKLKASLIEGYLFLPRLRRVRLDVFPRKDMTEDKYLEYIPFTWTSCNNRGAFLEADLLWDMMVISMLNFQVDEFMEAVVGTHFAHDQVLIQQLIEWLCVMSAEPASSPSIPSGGATSNFMGDSTLNKGTLTPPLTGYGSPTTLTTVESALRRFTAHILRHPRITAASQFSRSNLAAHLQSFLLAHLKHCSDNTIFAAQAQNLCPTVTPTFAADTTYWEWARTTGATNTSCPYSWAWLTCRLAGGRGCHSPNSSASDDDEPFPSAAAKFLAQDMAARLASMCRMYNDYGSQARDRAELSLNSVNFPEFERCGGGGGGSGGGRRGRGEPARKRRRTEPPDDASDLRARKAALLELAEFERAGVEAARARLLPMVSKRVRAVIGVFVDVTDLYGQIYVARDIGSRTRG